MKENPVSLKATGIKYGLITAAICIVYFLVMDMAGLIHITALRFFNYAFVLLGLFLAMNEVIHKQHTHRINYLPGIALGFIIVFINAIIFSIFIFIYARFVDLNFVSLITPDLPPYNGTLNSYIIGVFTFSESIMFGAVLSFIIMQYFKRNNSDSRLEASEEAAEWK